MKKFTLLLALMLALTCVGGALAEVDLTEVLENPNIFTLDVYNSNTAVVESTLTAKERSFTHKYESDAYFSATQFDFIVVDYLKSSAYPVLRLWISFATNDEFMDIDAVTFRMGGKSYTFDVVTDPDWYEATEKGYIQSVMIKFGWDNISFLSALESILPEDSDNLPETDGMITMTLHGREDIKVSLSGSFLLDFALVKTAFLEANGGDYLGKPDATPMTVK